MDTDQFWNLIETAGARAGDQADGQAIAAQAVAMLSALPAAEIISAEQRLHEIVMGSYLHPLWAAAYLINGGCSDDSFDYFRGWLILQGRTVFEEALADPDGLAGLPAVRAAVEAGGTDLRCEYTLYIASDAYRNVTGQELPEDVTPAGYPDLDPAWNFDFDDRQEMHKHLPRLTARCWPYD